MLRISRLADYGVVLGVRLAQLPAGELRSVRELTRETGIPQPTVSKILKHLARFQIVSSERGARGGYRLSRPAPQVSVAEMIVALEGPIGITECVSDEAEASEPGCEYQGRCEVHGNWNRINEALDAALRGITLEDMAAPAPPVLVPLRRPQARPTREGTRRLADPPATGSDYS